MSPEAVESARTRVFILGLDSATFDILDPLLKQGVLPNFERTVRNGTRARLDSTLPPRTPPAWVTCMTGQNPGKHGIFDFWNFEREGYDSVSKGLVTSSSYAGRTFFDLLSRSGKSVASLFVPMTFPAWQVNGVMVAGPPLAPKSERGLSFPASVHQSLGVRHDVHLHPPSLKGDGLSEQTHKDLMRMEEARAELALSLWKSGRYDCLMVVLESLDIVQHRCWNDYLDSQGVGTVIQQFYEKVDRILGQTLARLGSDDILFVISDHGMTAHPEVSFQTNIWLREQGLLALYPRSATATSVLRYLKDFLRGTLPSHYFSRLQERIKAAPAGIGRTIRMSGQGNSAVNWSQTAAFRVQLSDPPVEGIMLNVRGRQPEGIVAPESVGALSDKIKDMLLLVQDPSGRPVVRAVHRREDLYWGPYADRAPDLTVEFNEGFAAEGSVSGGVFSPTPLQKIRKQSGTHSPRGIFIAHGKPFSCGKSADPLRIVDFAAVLLYSMNQAVPASLDGEVPRQLFSKRFREQNELKIARSDDMPRGDEVTYTEAEKAQIEEKLRNLGYL